MKQIPLTKGQLAIVDDEDFEKLSKFKWYAHFIKKINSFYAEMRRPFSTNMHRFIMDAQPGQFVDHINHNTLDNRKFNIRIVSGTQNNLNRRKHIIKSSPYKGVSWNKSIKKWQAFIGIKKSKWLGCFNTPEEAARAYDNAAYAFDPVHALLNFPKKEL